MLAKFWPHLLSAAIILAVVWLIHHDGYKAGRDHILAQWAAERAALAEAVEKDRAAWQARTDAQDTEIAQLKAVNDAKKGEDDEKMEQATKNDNSPCDRLGDDVVRAHNAKISAGTR